MNCYYCNKDGYDFCINCSSNLKSIYFCYECISVFSGIEACRFVEKIKEQLKSTETVSLNLQKRGTNIYVNMRNGAVRTAGWLSIESAEDIFSREILKKLSVFV